LKSTRSRLPIIALPGQYKISVVSPRRFFIQSSRAMAPKDERSPRCAAFSGRGGSLRRRCGRTGTFAEVDASCLSTSAARHRSNLARPMRRRSSSPCRPARGISFVLIFYSPTPTLTRLGRVVGRATCVPGGKSPCRGRFP